MNRPLASPKAFPSMSTTETESRHIAVSGSGGMVGKALCELLEPEYRISRLSRGSAKVRSGSIPWVPDEGVSDPGLLESVDAIVHLAGRSIAASRWNRSEKQKLRDSRVLATQKLVKQICRLSNPPKTFVCASAIGIYGNSGSVAVNEDSPAGDDFLAELATDWERACEPLLEAGVRVCNARLGIVLDKSEGALAKLLPMFRWYAGGRIGDGRQMMSWVALEDCVAAIRWLLESSTSGPFNLTAPHAVSNEEFTAALGTALGKPTYLPVPAAALRLALGEMADALLLSSCNAVPQRLLSAGFEFRWPELLPFLKAELGTCDK